MDVVLERTTETVLEDCGYCIREQQEQYQETVDTVLKDSRKCTGEQLIIYSDFPNIKVLGMNDYKKYWTQNAKNIKL